MVSQKKDSTICPPPATNSLDKWTIVRVPVALLLLLAAISKIANAVSIVESDGLLSMVPLLLIVILVETCVAIYLFIGNPIYSRRASVVIFCIFVGSLGYALITGQDCNCISQAITPRSMLIIDILVLAGLCYCRPVYKTNESNARTEASRVTVALLVGLLASSFGAYQLQSTDRSDPLEFLLADELLGKQWPLTSRLHPDLYELESGRWLVLVVRKDCVHCRELVAEYFSDSYKTRDNERTAIFIAGTNDWQFQLDNVSLDIESLHSINWPNNEPFVASPAVFVLRDKIVEEAADGNEADQLLMNLFQNR